MLRFRGRRHAGFVFALSEQIDRAARPHIPFLRGIHVPAEAFLDVNYHMRRTHIDDVTVMTMAELRALPREAPDIGSGIYFLWNDDELVYIGMARNIADRVIGHKRAAMGFRTGKKIEFNSYSFFLWDDEPWMHEVELLYILAYRPRFNEKLV